MATKHRARTSSVALPLECKICGFWVSTSTESGARFLNLCREDGTRRHVGVSITGRAAAGRTAAAELVANVEVGRAYEMLRITLYKEEPWLIPEISGGRDCNVLCIACSRLIVDFAISDAALRARAARRTCDDTGSDTTDTGAADVATTKARPSHEEQVHDTGTFEFSRAEFE